MTDTKQAASICPLCGASNQCAIAAGEPPESCWCQQATISTAAREKVNKTSPGRCLCPACGQPTEDSQSER